MSNRVYTRLFIRIAGAQNLLSAACFTAFAYYRLATFNLIFGTLYLLRTGYKLTFILNKTTFIILKTMHRKFYGVERNEIFK